MITVGIDEVGRGCWAGPLVTGAVILNHAIPGLKDSKKLSRIQRRVLYEHIHQQAEFVGIGWVWPEDIDKYGITWSVKTAMERSLQAICIEYDEIIIDGNYNFLSENILSRCVVKADDLIPAVSAASIVAKVARDTYMIDIAQKNFPEYYFSSHVGYGTKKHSEALAAFGPTPIHRMSYKPIQHVARGLKK